MLKLLLNAEVYGPEPLGRRHLLVGAGKLLWIGEQPPELDDSLVVEVRDLVRQALDNSEIPARVFNPTHVNRRRELFDEALALAERGCTVDVTAYPVREGDKGWSAEQAIVRYLDSGLPAGRITVSSDGGWLPAGIRCGWRAVTHGCRVARNSCRYPGQVARPRSGAGENIAGFYQQPGVLVAPAR